MLDLLRGLFTKDDNYDDSPCMSCKRWHDCPVDDADTPDFCSWYLTNERK